MIPTGRVTVHDVSQSLIYKIHDSDDEAVCPHVSFDNPRKPEDAELRSSVETRSIVITADG